MTHPDGSVTKPDGTVVPPGGTAGGGATDYGPPIDPGSSLIHRMNTPEYNNTLADVLGTTQTPADGLWAAEETAGFNNQAAVQLVDDKQYQRYFNAANLVAADVFANAALKAKVVTCATTDDATCVNGIINAVGLKLFRRPLTADETTTYHKVYTDARALGLLHEPALQNVLVSLLSSSQFIYRMEFDDVPTSTTVHDLSGYELASRLSYFLWQSAPDDALLKVAADNSLTKTDVLTAQIERAAADPKFERFTKSFVGQWLGVRKVGAHAVTISVFPDWTPALGDAMANEVYSFFDEFAKGNLPWTDFVKADVNFVNADLAKLYGMPAPAAGTQRVTNTTDNRFGFFGMGAFLALSSYEYRTAPTLRGRWILLNMLCTPPREPPPGVPKLDAMPNADASQQNVRQRLEMHRANPVCASCHATLDPYGLALENFDAIGKYRSTYPNGSAIDASTVTLDGTKFTGLSGLSDQVAKQPSLLTCVQSQLFTYAQGARAEGYGPAVPCRSATGVDFGCALAAASDQGFGFGGYVPQASRRTIRSALKMTMINRRTVLSGAGVALTLPWLASLAPRASAAGTPAPKRFLPVFFPNGSAEWWRPAAVGKGDAWQLSPILQPFQALKKKMIVLTNLENYTPFAVLSGPAELNPSHGQAPGAFLSCIDANVVRKALKNDTANGITVDQLIAQDPAYSNRTKLPSMQVGLSTIYSYCDGRDCSVSRSISWKDATSPTYKDVDPGTIFDRIVAAKGPDVPAGTTPTVDPEAVKRKALGKSALDAVLASAASVRAKLGSSDQKTMDQFLDSVRTVETNAQNVSTTMGGGSVACAVGTRPTLKATPDGIPTNVPGGYSKETHADVMNDLIVMAFQCDVTRIISYMMEDERSEFVYSHVPKRKFTAAGSSPSTSATDLCGNYHGAQHAGSANDDFATINWWQSGKIAALASRLDAMPDGEGASVLDNTVIMYASCMHGGNHQSNDLPVALLGGGSGSLLTDQHVKFPDAIGSDRPLRDLYYTLLQKTFGLNVTSFGSHIQNIPNSLITEILKA